MDQLTTSHFVGLAIFMLFPISTWIAAKEKGRNPIPWALSCLFFWFVPMLVLSLLKPKKEIPGETKKCPHCGKIVNYNSSVCKYCYSRILDESTSMNKMS